MKKLVYIHASIFPSESANTIQVLRMCEAFSNLGYRVELFGYKYGMNYESIYDIYSLSGDIKITLIKFKKIPFNFDLILYTISTIFFYNPIIYTRNILVAFFLSFFFKKIILELHQPEVKNRNVSMLKNLIRRGKVKLVFISNGLKIIFSQVIDLDNVDCVTAHDGFSSELRDLAKSRVSLRTKPLEKLRVFYSGSVRSGRGIELLLGAAKVLREIDFYFAGDVQKYQAFQGIDGQNVNFLGRLSQQRVYEESLVSDVLVALFDKRVEISGGDLSSVEDYCSPLKLFEYMSCGKIIITVPYQVFFEFLDKNEALFINYEEKELISVLRNVLCKRENYLDMKTKCFERAKDFSYENRALKVERLFDFS